MPFQDSRNAAGTRVHTTIATVSTMYGSSHLTPARSMAGYSRSSGSMSPRNQVKSFFGERILSARMPISGSTIMAARIPTADTLPSCRGLKPISRR